MSLLVRNLSRIAVFGVLQAASPPTAPPAGGPPVPWAAVSIHVSSADAQGESSSGDQPDGITARRQSLKELISWGYNFGVMPLRDEEIVGLPEWARSTRYDVLARVDSDDVEAFKKISNLSMADTITAFSARRPTSEMLMIQSLLTDRFHLRVHWEARERSVYSLLQAKSGLRIRPAADPKHGEMTFNQGHLAGKGVPLAFLASLLSLPAERTVLDKTNLSGTYDFDLRFSPLNEPASEAASNDPDLFTAVQEQLGLKLQSAHQPVPVLVVDHIDQPTPN